MIIINCKIHKTNIKRCDGKQNIAEKKKEIRVRNWIRRRFPQLFISKIVFRHNSEPSKMLFIIYIRMLWSNPISPIRDLL